MTRLLALYKQPADEAAFDRYYFGTHALIARKLPGLRSYVVSSKSPELRAGDDSPYLVAELDFDNESDLRLAMESPEGQATADDLFNFAMAGVTIITYDLRSL